ncbi:alpha-glucosidase [Penicillium malachiteum]|uniref:alpha-glucosidase n=1 Tax=Penicillium malachiteum TaxID=1324776 RepID=UPI0025473B9C|nr:alpha-glucosidase [Penicillium malachiteum]KAJ5734913.1 alpha-glucosidase [Penicillium malachiteum]
MPDLSSNYTAPKWWKDAIVYQVYPASFKSSKPESHADGWGDVRGITEKVPYLKSLGVDVVWTSPIYKSPQVDMGYDISDYKSIEPRYGSLADVDSLIKVLNDHDMKLMMDLVVTHTSDQHEWFIESSQSKDSLKHDWYIWKPARDYSSAGRPLPPNNWAQILNDSQSAWTWSEDRQEFYLTLHTSEQVDLNWENPDVVAAVHDVMHFWLSRGVSGFRMDVINLISKDPAFPDAPVMEPDCEFQPGERFYTNGPRFHEFMHDIYDNVLSKYDTITVGEAPYVDDISEIIKTVGSTAKELNMIFIFDHMEIQDVKTKGNSKWSLRDWKLPELKKIFSSWQKRMIEWDGWNTVFLECHDQARSVSRYVDDSDGIRERGSKLLALLQTTLGGTLYLFQGQEIGMRNFSAEWDPDVDYKDVESISFWQKSKRLYGHDSAEMQKARYLLQRKARDHARTPMQWDSSPNAGFTTSNISPWMRVNDDYPTVNVKAQINFEGEELSVWQYWQLTLQNRKTHSDVFVYGDYQDVDVENERIYAYLRTGTQTKEKWLVAMNWTGEKSSWNIPPSIKVEQIVSSSLQRKLSIEDGAIVKLQAWEGILMRCK